MKRIIITVVGIIIVIALSVGVSLASASGYKSCPGAGSGNAVVVKGMSCKTGGHVLMKAGQHMIDHPRSFEFHVTSRGVRYLCEAKLKSSHTGTVACATSYSSMGAYLHF